MYTIYIIYKNDENNPEQVAIFNKVEGLVIDGNMVEVYQGGEMSNVYTFTHIISIQYLEEVGK